MNPTPNWFGWDHYCMCSHVHVSSPISVRHLTLVAWGQRESSGGNVHARAACARLLSHPKNHPEIREHCAFAVAAPEFDLAQQASSLSLLESILQTRPSFWVFVRHWCDFVICSYLTLTHHVNKLPLPQHLWEWELLYSHGSTITVLWLTTLFILSLPLVSAVYPCWCALFICLFLQG